MEKKKILTKDRISTMFKMWVKDGFGQVSVGRGLGIVYGHAEMKIPPSWFFIDKNLVKSAEEIQNLVTQYKMAIGI